MIRLNEKVPKDIFVACSGGPDSMAAVDFLNNGRRNVTAVYFDHGTAHGNVAKKFVSEYCNNSGIPLVTSSIQRDRDNNESLEEYWRNCRYDFFHSLSGPVVTAHHLDDVCEWWMFTSMHGTSRLIPPSNKNVLRPFLMTGKEELVNWCLRHDVPYLNDPSNNHERFRRNFIRHNMMKHVFTVNPGFRKVMVKKLLQNAL